MIGHDLFLETNLYTIRDRISRTQASRASITGLRAPDFTTMDVGWEPWTVLVEIARRDEPGPFFGGQADFIRSARDVREGAT
jgi:hypothetical protein